MGWLGRFWAYALHERLLLVLILAIIAFTILTFALIGWAFVLRFRNVKTARLRTQMEANWEDAILEALAGERTPESVTSMLKPEEQLFFLDVLSRFARRLRGSEGERISALAAPMLPRLAARLGHEDPTLRARAVETISILGMDTHAGHMVTALDDPAPLVAMMAARSLAHRRDATFAAPIVSRLDRFLAWDPKLLAATLSAMGPDAAPVLRECVRDEERNPVVRAIAAAALNRLNDLEAADTAARVLRRATHRELVVGCLRLLRFMGRPEHVPAIRPFLQHEDDIVRAQAIGAMGALADVKEVEALEPHVADPSPWVSLEAARAMRLVRGGEVLKRIAAAEGDPRGELARQVLAEARA